MTFSDMKKEIRNKILNRKSVDQPDLNQLYNSPSWIPSGQSSAVSILGSYYSGYSTAGISNASGSFGEVTFKKKQENETAIEILKRILENNLKKT